MLTTAYADDQSSGQKPQDATAINTVCPDSGDKVGSMGKPVYVSYHGKKIALCCQQCLRDFGKNPEKYAPLADKNTASGQ
jgi:YHS domain-containing protein